MCEKILTLNPIPNFPISWTNSDDEKSIEWKDSFFLMSCLVSGYKNKRLGSDDDENGPVEIEFNPLLPSMTKSMMDQRNVHILVFSSTDDEFLFLYLVLSLASSSQLLTLNGSR